MITDELYDICIDYLAWYDDMVYLGCGGYLTQNDIRKAQLAEEIINLWLKGM